MPIPMVHRRGNAVLLVILAVVVIAIIIVAVMLTREQESTNANVNANVNTANANTNVQTNVNTAPVNTNTSTNAETTDVNTNSSPSTGNTNTSATNTNTAANTNSSTTTAKTVDVSITSSGFSPRTVTINAGDTIRWTNNSGRSAYVAPDFHPTHRAYAGVWDDDGTGEIANGRTYSFTFTKSGTYDYHDHLISSRTGTVVVE